MSKDQVAICSHCKKDGVKAYAFAVWDEDDQEWALARTMAKRGWCSDCNKETAIEMVDIIDDDEVEDMETMGEMLGRIDDLEVTLSNMMACLEKTSDGWAVVTQSIDKIITNGVKLLDGEIEQEAVH